METLDPNLLAIRISVHHRLAKSRLLLQLEIHRRSKGTSIHQGGKSPLVLVIGLETDDQEQQKDD